MSKPATSSRKSPSVRTITTRLKALQSSFDTIHTFVEGFNEELHSANDVLVRLERIDSLWEQINDTVNELLSHDEFVADPAAVMEERTLYENRYYSSKSFLMDKHKLLADPPVLDQTSRTNVSFSQGATPHVRLPQITLPKFSGNIEEWISFRDLYTSLIHWQADLPEVEKLHYLRSQLQGEALSVIEALPICSANYKTAWELLVQRYSNMKVIKRKQVQGIFDLPFLKRECASDLHTLLENFERIIKTLDQLVQPIEYKDLLLLHILSARLDSSTRRSWEEQSSSKDSESLKDLTDFLTRRIRVLEALPVKSAEQRNETTQLVRKRPFLLPQASCSAVQQGGLNCVICQETHPLYKCAGFNRMGVSEREGVLRAHSLCRNCFYKGHQAKDCNSKVSCKKCRARHHTMVCFKANSGWKVKDGADAEDTVSTKQNSVEPSETKIANVAVEGTVTSAACSTEMSSSKVLLATALVTVQDETGLQATARVLLDSGSECNFISRRLCQQFKTQHGRVQVPVSGIGQSKTVAKAEVRLKVLSRNKKFMLSVTLLVLPKITVELPTANIDVRKWNIPSHVKLADPGFNCSKPIDMILGGSAFFDLFGLGQQIRLGDNLPKLIDTAFGWVVAGEYSSRLHQSLAACHTATVDFLEDFLPRFWSCEEVGLVGKMSPKELLCEEQFVRTVQRAENGRYTVTLPKDDTIMMKLGESKEIAFRRLQGLERRFERDPLLRERYCQFLMEYLDSGHMRKVEESTDTCGKRYFLPHHPVVKESSTTTKVRVVFDASCRSTSGVSLNDGLIAGPVIQDDLRSIVFRCRTRQFMVVADVEKMFRQVLVAPEDRLLQNILWRFDTKERPVTYELSTITYGMKPSPYLATRTLRQLALDEAHSYPFASKVAQEDIYMDDLISGADDLPSTCELTRQLVTMMHSGGFHLRKWASNHKQTLEGIPREDLAIQDDGVELDPDPTVKTLGLIWLPKTDAFKLQFNIPLLDTTRQLTKRMLLSTIATLFDPLGLVGAIITTAKLFMQQLWILPSPNGGKLGWDEVLPEAVESNWRRFYAQLPVLDHLRIPRCVVMPNTISQEMHSFSDASERAYGACVYLKCTDATGQVFVSLLASKSRVAPLKTQSLPRLELCGALIAVELFERVSTSMRYEGDAFFWSDSMTVLQWLKAVPATWTTFVANRVAKIQGLTKGAPWGHVPGNQNPADLISRGMLPEEIPRNDFWWHGPRWLSDDSVQRPTQSQISLEPRVMEERRQTAVALVAAEENSFLTYLLQTFSCYTDLLRKTAYCLRFMGNLRNKRNGQNLRSGFLTTRDLREAEWMLVRLVQEETFGSEVKLLRKGEPVGRSSRIRWFNPFFSRSEQVIRVGGRLSNSVQPEEAKHPAVLPARHAFTRLLLLHYHRQLLHAGPQLLLATARLRFWPLGGRNLARDIVHNCVTCFRFRPTAVQQFMADLPAARVIPTRPFTKTGVDYFGPVYYRQAPRRAVVKSYVSVFICLVTRAVHLELVTDLSTERFIQALRRFIARRGKPSDMFSDNGRNFVGAKNQLAELLQKLKKTEYHECIVKECSKDGIYWHFNPPASPHFGGIWEAAVRSAKIHLLKVLGQHVVYFEDLQTLLTQVEGCLNSRPLTALSDDPTDLEPLTPAHFLIGSSLQSVPDRNYESIPENRLKHWQATQQKLQHFWCRWKREYLAQLQGRMKRWKPPVPIKVGELVILQDDNSPPYKWPLGRILKVHPGADNVTRVVTLKTATGTYVRPVEKLCLLPIVPEDC